MRLSRLSLPLAFEMVQPEAMPLLVELNVISLRLQDRSQRLDGDEGCYFRTSFFESLQHTKCLQKGDSKTRTTVVQLDLYHGVSEESNVKKSKCQRLKCKEDGSSLKKGAQGSNPVRRRAEGDVGNKELCSLKIPNFANFSFCG